MSQRPPGPTYKVKRQPDFDNLRRTLLRQGPPGPVPFIELFADPAMIETALGEKFPFSAPDAEDEFRSSTPRPVLRGRHVLDMILRFCYETGYDYVFAWTGLNFPGQYRSAAPDTASAWNWPGGSRYWQDETSGPIQSWKDIEEYPWPKPEEISCRALEYLNLVVPDGMKISVVIGGVFENASWLMGLQSFAYALHDQPDLVAAVCQRVGEITTAAAYTAVTIDNVGMVFLGDDVGYKTATLISPADLRRYVLPYHKRLADTVHAAGRLFLLHSCGNVESIMDDLIDDVGIDGKHSFEDVIMPVEEVYRRWGGRTAILGGVDMDLLAGGSEDQVRARTRQVLERCGASGTGYCLGTGNTPANYVPLANYLAMLDEGRRWNREHFGP
jgi:uroporphyrinogen decarboxylase